jgi:aminopeptidase N
MRDRSSHATSDYFPGNGDLSYSVRRYDLSIDYTPSSNQLVGRAVIEAAALVDLDEISLDLHGLSVARVAVDVVGVEKFWTRVGKLRIRTTEVIEAGELFRVTVRYRGRPASVRDAAGDGMGWEELEDGVLVAGQTNGAPSWFPCNDRPIDKASYRLAITAPSVYHVVSNGALVSRHRGASTTTWVYEQNEPMATYLATVQIGRYVVRTDPGSAVPLTFVLPMRHLDRYELAFGRQADMIDFFVRTFGPYPFGGYTVVITDDELDIPLESQGLSVFGSNLLTDEWDSVRLVAHELSHQWFGNSLTLTTWSDIWLHEGFACYSEWLWSEESGSRSTHERAVHHWNKLTEKVQPTTLANPGPKHMFDDWVYKRGALLLHSLRLTIGDGQFFDLLRRWVSSHTHGSVSTSRFIALAEEVSGGDLRPLFKAWLSQTTLPDLPS